MDLSRLKPLLDTTGASDHPVVRTVTATAALLIALGLLASVALNVKNPALARDIRVRTLTWIALLLITFIPVIAGRLWAILLFAALSLLCYREFARATGLFRWRLVSALVTIGILAVTFVNLDHNPPLLTMLVAVIPVSILALSVLQDTPAGYIQRCALGASAFLLFGVGFGRLGALTAEPQYRAVLATLLGCCQFSDVAAFCCGKSLRTRHLFPNTSPGKTLGGHLGALLIVAPAAAVLFHLTFEQTPMGVWHHCIILGTLTAVLAQLGDLVVSSIKRDIGIKDMGADLPGHGGVLDRCNSLLLAAPAVYHYINTVQGAGMGVPFRLLTSSSAP